MLYVVMKCGLQGVPTFNDDIQATAAAVLASLYGATKVSGVPQLQAQRFLFFGAGQANIGSARIVTQALMSQGLDEGTARSRIWLYDSKVCSVYGRL